jgi:hypothetical protein
MPDEIQWPVLIALPELSFLEFKLERYFCRDILVRVILIGAARMITKKKL